MKSLRYLDATQIKLFAIILMVGDHIHQMFNGFGAPIWLTYPGRLVFPLFLFVAADSFHYTSNRRKYLQRLLYASWSMTLFSTTLQSLLPNDTIVLTNNAFSTFFLTGLYIVSWDRFVVGLRNRDKRKVISALLLSFVPVLSVIPTLFILSFSEQLPMYITRVVVILSMLIPNLLLVEGGFFMVFLGLAFYILRKQRLAQIGVLVIFSAVVFKIGSGMQWLMVFAAVPMLLYNGERGQGLKWLFYIFYPAHIFLFYVLATIMA